MVETPAQTATLDNLVTHKLEFGGHTLDVSNFAVDRLINDSLENHHVWEPWQLHLMDRIIKPDFTCVDVGANVGINAMFAGLLCRRGRVLAYEPFDQIFAVMRRNVEQNRLPHVVPINKGLSDANIALEMVADVRSIGGAHVTEAQFSGGDYATTTAHFARLDDQMREHGVSRIDFIKIDVEGHEMKVLAGGPEYLRNPDLQMTIEFSPIQHFRTSLEAGPFADRALFEKLRKDFRHVFYMTRELTLLEMPDWHTLRRRLMGGYFVDDLYCVNSVRPEVADMVVAGPAVAPQVQVTHEQIGPMQVTHYNRDPDGWGMGDDYNPPIASMSIRGARGRPVVLKFNPMWRKHLPNGHGYPSWPVWVAAGDAVHRLDLIDAPVELSIEASDADTLDITIQSEHKTTAAAYLGNPNDPRTLGFRVEVH
jgi:FkbM family methyltransferase